MGSISVDVFTRPDIEHIGTDSVDIDDSIDVEALIEGEQEAAKNEDRPDIMYIGIIPKDCTYKWDDIKYYWPRPVSFHQWSIKADGIDSGNTVNQREFLELNRTTSHPDDMNLHDSMYTQQVIDTTVKHCIKFVRKNRILSPSGVFNIHGQRFACEKLEYTITSKGVSPLVTGYFYRLS